MRKRTGYSRADDFAVLSLQIASGKPQPAVQPSALPLASIRLWPKVFQHRNTAGHASRSHVLSLTAALRKRKSRTLDALTVWWDGKGWACVDGHHRHAAYKAVGVGTIPVNVFAGSLAQAMAAAAGANTKDKLIMTRTEKSDAAWHMVTMIEMSKAEVAAAAGVSESTVANMRKVQGLLDVRANSATNDLDVSMGGDYRDLSWTEAKGLAECREPADFDREAANEQKAQGMAEQLRKSLGKEAAKYPEIFARAIELYDSRLLDQITEWWGTQDDDAEDGDLEDGDL